MSETASLDALKALAADLVEIEKRVLLEDKEEYGAAVAVVITPQGRYWQEVEFEDADEKIAAYAEIVRNAKENGATAIITLNSSRWKLVTSDGELADYRWGDLQASESPRAIVVTISCPGIESCSMSLPYAFEKGVVLIGDPTAFEPAIVDLSPDWP